MLFSDLTRLLMKKHVHGFLYMCHLIPEESAAAVGSPSWVLCSTSEGLCVPPTGGDRVAGATYELSAGSFHWAHKSFPEEKDRGNVSCYVGHESPLKNNVLF